jgi:mono/diheme cytochrome c family protein
VYPAPPHNNDGHTWHHPDQQLLDIIAAGGNLPNSAMPGFSGKLTQRQMEAVLGYIKTFWGPDELRFQNGVTQAREKQNQ